MCDGKYFYALESLMFNIIYVTWQKVGHGETIFCETESRWYMLMIYILFWEKEKNMN